jgi:CubicO group peptidase (beta-lactamase class C family)
MGKVQRLYPSKPLLMLQRKKMRTDRQAKQWLARGIPGLALAVAIDGKVVYSEGFGYADLEERVPVWSTTKFRIGSISKPLTAIALMELVEAGKVDLDAPVQKYVPSFPDKGAVITVRMVAGTSGESGTIREMNSTSRSTTAAYWKA